MNQTPILGVDIAKQKIDVFFLSNASHAVYSNDNKGFKALLKRLKKLKAKAKIVMEASGGYERDLFDFFTNLGYTCSIVNPKRIRDFAKGIGLLAKTDKIDAMAIAKYAQAVDPRPTPAPSPEQKRLQAICVRRRAVVKMKIAEQNRLRLAKNEDSVASIKGILKVLKTEIRELDKKLAALTKSVKGLKEKSERLKSVPGVGPRTATVILRSCRRSAGSQTRRSQHSWDWHHTTLKVGLMWGIATSVEAVKVSDSACLWQPSWRAEKTKY